MANQDSVIASKQALALIKGPSVGSHGQESGGKLQFLHDSVSLPVGTIVAATPERVRFGKLPANSKFVRHLSRLVTDHTAAVAGRLVFTPLDGTAVTTLTGVTLNLEATTGHSVPITGAPIEILKDSWVDFIPTADLVVATTAKNVWAEIAYTVNS